MNPSSLLARLHKAPKKTVKAVAGVISVMFDNWQPAAVICGSILFIGGATATIWQHLGIAPAVAVLGFLTATGGILWAKVAVVTDEVAS